MAYRLKVVFKFKTGLKKRAVTNRYSEMRMKCQTAACKV